MSLWIRLPALAVLSWFSFGPPKGPDLDQSPPAVGNAEAARLYADADDYVTNVTENLYSYAYMQFYWKRAEAFVERAERVYPDSPTARKLRAGELKVGPYTLAYFKDRVLPRLEEKRSYAVDELSCAGFLYGLNLKRRDAVHELAFERIMEVFARQDRWGEALAFPTAPDQHLDLLRTLYQEAARSPTGQRHAMSDLRVLATSAGQAEAGFPSILGQAYALLGVPRTKIAAFLTVHPQDAVRLAVLKGMIEREVQIRRRAALRIPVGDEIDATHYTLLHLKVRDDVDSVARQFFPRGLPPAARDLLAGYRAALGQKPADGAPLAVRIAYLEYLGAAENFDQLESAAQVPGLTPPERQACALKVIEMLAQGGRRAEADRRRAAYIAAGGSADQAELAEVDGEIASTEDPLVVRPGTFASLPISDPCVLATAIMDWSLAPTREIRGAAPWDAVVRRFEPGFANLPLPKSAAVGRAAAATNPY